MGNCITSNKYAEVPSETIKEANLTPTELKEIKEKSIHELIMEIKQEFNSIPVEKNRKSALKTNVFLVYTNNDFDNWLAIIGRICPNTEALHKMVKYYKKS